MIPLLRPYMPELPEIDEVLHSGKLAYGNYAKLFEDQLKKYFDTEYVLVVNSFQSAIDVVMSTMDMNVGDEIIASPMACLASTQPLADYGLKIVWGDVDNHKGTLSPDSVLKKITPATKCIFHNHFCGYPGYIEEINAIAKERDIKVVDDGIECFGSIYRGKKIGTQSDATIFSLSPVRLPNTIDGGVIIFKEKDMFEKSLLIRDCGIDRTKFRDKLGEINLDCDIALKGYSAMPSEVLGYIGCKQMEEIDGLIHRQRRQAYKWKQYFLKENVQPLTIDKGDEPNFWVYGLYVNDNKIEFIKKYREKGYYASGVHINNNRYSVFGERGDLPGTEDFYQHFVAMPCGWWMED